MVHDLGFLALWRSLVLLPFCDWHPCFVHLLDLGKCSSFRLGQEACVHGKNDQYAATEDEVCLGTETTNTGQHKLGWFLDGGAMKLTLQRQVQL